MARIANCELRIANLENKIDKENLYEVIEKMPKQLVEGLEIARDVKVEGKFDSITISGMGGSAWPANILRIYLNDLFYKKPKANHRFAVYQNRFYSLPPEAYNNSLNIISSYSGTTEEAVSSFEDAIKNNLPSVGIASGGKVLEMCEANNIPCAVLPQGIQPRIASPYNFAVLFGILVNCGMVEDEKEAFQNASGSIEKQMENFREQGEKLAAIVANKTPVIYTSTKFKSLAMIWKIMINENAKTPAFWNFFPELNHNEANSYLNPQGKFHVIMLRDSKDHPQNYKRFDVTKKVLEEYGTDSTIVDIPEGDLLFRIFSILQIGCWMSYYLALQYGIDPTPVEIVEKFKKLLTK